MSTLGEERANNPLLAFESEEDFFQWFPGTFPRVPSYFFRMRPINRAGPRLRRDISRPLALPPAEFSRLRDQALVIDVRPLAEYSAGHIPGSLSNTFRGVYPIWLGWLVPEAATLLFVTGDAPLDQIIDESELVGFERFAGWLDGGLEAWAASGKPVQQMPLLDGRQARKVLLDGAVALDVREPNEVAAGHIDGSVNIPLGSIEAQLAQLPTDRSILAYCGHGERSATALSLLERSGFSQLLNLNGGVNGWIEAGNKLVSASGTP